MSAPHVAIVGSGMIGSTLAYELTRRGIGVAVYEKGVEYPYPHRPQFMESVHYDHVPPGRTLPRDLVRTTHAGSYPRDLSLESVHRVGGSGTAWTALATRMAPSDFRTRTLRGFGDDWPITYEELEPWMCRAEEQLGVSGTDDDNPWAPPRSRPYPLPAFAFTPDDALLAERLARDGIHLHTTAQARTRLDYRGRSACMNVGECQVCPNGARYSPNHHLQLALDTGRCRLETRTSVRRVITDASGRARGLLVRPNDARDAREHPADVVVVAAAAIESARLLLLSTDARHPAGLGNSGGHVGRHLVFHHIWTGHMHYAKPMFAGRVGFWTAQSDQFCDPPERGHHGGVKIEMPSRPWIGHVREAGEATDFDEALRRFERTRRCRQIGMHAESLPGDGKHVTLSEQRDRFGDPVAHVTYGSDGFDHRTHAFSRALVERVARATAATDWTFPGVEDFGVFAHYMGTTRMGSGPDDSVTDTFGGVHDTPGLFTIGLGSFVGSGGAVNPTLTGVALALRTADFLAASLGRP